MADGSQNTPPRKNATAQNDTWQRIGDVAKRLIGAELARIEAARKAWLSEHRDVSGGGNPRISRAEYSIAERDSEGYARAFGLCRACGNEVSVSVYWDDDADGRIAPMSTGRGPGCHKSKCGDAMPADFTRMVATSDYFADPVQRRFQEIYEGIEVARQNNDETGEKMWRETLVKERFFQNMMGG